MIPVIGISGKSGVGKTTLAVKLVEELNKRSVKVAAIKHTRHRADIDHEGKDTDLYHKAGAKAVSLATDGKVMMYMDTDEPWTPDNIVRRLFPEVDLVLVEGFGDAPIPKICVVRKEVAPPPDDQKGFIAFVSEDKVDTSLPVYSFKQTKQIADLLMDYVDRLGPKRDVSLYVNEKKVFIKPFIKDFFLKTIAAMVDSLRGTQKARRITIVIDKPEGEAEEDDG